MTPDRLAEIEAEVTDGAGWLCMVIRELVAEVRRLQGEVAAYRARLEIDHVYTLGSEPGELVREEVPEVRKIPDGIECRDETIRLQDEEIKRLQDEHRTCARIQTIVKEYAADPESVKRLGVVGVPWLDAILAELARLRGRVAELETAAGPFVLQAELWDDVFSDPDARPPDTDPLRPIARSPWPTIGDVRRLAAAVRAAYLAGEWGRG